MKGIPSTSSDTTTSWMSSSRLLSQKRSTSRQLGSRSANERSSESSSSLGQRACPLPAMDRNSDSSRHPQVSRNFLCAVLEEALAIANDGDEGEVPIQDSAVANLPGVQGMDEE